MTKFVYGYGFNVGVYWERRAETPDALAARFVRMIDRLREIASVFALRTCVTTRRRRFETMRDRYAEAVAEGLIKSDWAVVAYI